jgi:hypothetical protein
MNKGSRNKDLASVFGIEDAVMRNVAGGATIIRTTLPGGGQPGDPTAASFEYNDELEDTVTSGAGVA